MPLIDATATEQLSDELAVLRRLVPLQAQHIIELGCGAAAFSRRLLAQHPACSVLALEVDQTQLAANLAAPPTPGLRFIGAGAEAVPCADASCDLALMLKSLHHVPLPLLDQALAEVRRVLRPGGYLYVSEPVFAGTLNEINRLFNDEEAVRLAAYQALQRAVASGGWRQVAESHFLMPSRFADFDDYERRQTSVTFAERRWTPALRESVRQRFEALRPPAGQPFLRPMRVNLLQTT